MRIEVIERKIYQFNELSEEAKEKARDWWRIGTTAQFDAEYVIDDAVEVGKLLGISFDTSVVKLLGGGLTRKPEVYWSLGYSQSDGVCFEGTYAYAKGGVAAIKAYAPKDEELHRIAEALKNIQKKYFYKLIAGVSCYNSSHSMCVDVAVYGYRVNQKAEDTVKGLIYDFAHWIFHNIRRAYEYEMSNENVDENIIANEYEFTESGERA